VTAPTPPPGTAGGDRPQRDYQQPDQPQGYPQQGYPQQDYPQQGGPQSYPGQSYPGQEYTGQDYLGQAPTQQDRPRHGAHSAPSAEAGWSEEHRPDVEGVSVGELIGNVTRDLSTLMRQELQLARAELKQEASKTGKAAGALTGAGLAGWFVLLFLSIALWAGLSNLMDSGWAGLIVAAIWAVIAAILYTVGRSRLREVRPKPDRTVDTLSNVPDALKGQRGGTP
jgi:hypothetical protein